MNDASLDGAPNLSVVGEAEEEPPNKTMSLEQAYAIFDSMSDEVKDLLGIPKDKKPDELTPEHWRIISEKMSEWAQTFLGMFISLQEMLRGTADVLLLAGAAAAIEGHGTTLEEEPDSDA